MHLLARILRYFPSWTANLVSDTMFPEVGKQGNIDKNIMFPQQCLIPSYPGGLTLTFQQEEDQKHTTIREIPCLFGSLVSPNIHDVLIARKLYWPEINEDIGSVN